MLQPVEAIAEFGQESPEPVPENGAADPCHRDSQPSLNPISQASSMIKLDAEASEGESLDSQVILAMQEANRLHALANHNNDPTRISQQMAESMLRDKSYEDSTHILARQIESL